MDRTDARDPQGLILCPLPLDAAGSPRQPPPLDVALRYHAAGGACEQGGDWHDVIRLPGRELALVIGDCMGCGLGAATAMSQLRAAARALLLHGLGPAEMLRTLDEFAATVEGAFCATACCAVVDPATGDLTYSSAAHPPAIVVTPPGGPVLLDEGRGLPIGVSNERRPQATDRLSKGSTLLMYTDGLVERPDTPISAGVADAAKLLQSVGDADLEAIADTVVSGLQPPAGFQDDVAVLVYRHGGC